MARALCLSAVTFRVGTAYGNPTISSEDGFRFDFDADHDGEVMSGTDDAYLGYGYLTVNAATFSAEADLHRPAFGGHGFYSEVERVGAFDVVRSASVPPEGGNWARYVDSFTNTSAVAETLAVLYQGNLGSADRTTVVSTSNGDASLGTDDRWAITDDDDASGTPTLGHVIAGPGARVSPSDLSLTVAPWDWGTTTLSWEYEPIRVEPGETVSILWFAIQEIDRAAALGACEDVSLLLARAHADLGPESETVVNWDFSGMPVASVDGPIEVAEGSDADFVGSGWDPDGRPLTLSWDLDDDERYELVADRVSWSASELDGPETRTVRFAVTNDVPEMDSEVREVVVTNLPPTAPVLVAPADGAIVAGPSVEIAATASEDVASDVVSYRLEFHADADYTELLRAIPIVGGAAGAGGVLRVDVDLDDGTYFWRLKAADDDGAETPWLAASFTVGDAPAPDAGAPDAGDADADADSDVDSDSDSDSDTDVDRPHDDGCHCASAVAGPQSNLLLVLGLFALRRGRNGHRNSEAPHA